MHLKTIVTLGLGSALLVGCGDDEEVTTAGATASGGGTDTDGGTDSASSASVSDSVSGSDSDSDSNTTTASAGTDSGGTDSAGTDSAGTDSAGTDSAGTDSAGTDSAGTDSAGTDSAGTDSGSTGGSTTTDSGGTGNMVICEAPGEIMPCDDGTDDPFNAIGLNCPFGENSAIPISNEVFMSPDAQAWQIASQFGDYVDPVTMEPIWGPREGSSFLIISTGHIDAPDANGVISMAQGAHQTGVNNGNPDDVPLPAPMSPLPGSNGGAGGTPFVNCDGVNDCSDSLNDQWIQGGSDARDLLWFQFDVLVPGGTFGYSFEFAYFSAEFPEWVNSTFNDIFTAWSASETYTGNLCFVNDQPCTVTALDPEVIYTQNAPELVGTGFDNVGESPGWFTAQGTASPNETLQLTFAIFDMGDSSWDTAVILDNFAWDCEGCVPSEVDPCIGIDPV